MKFLLIIGNSVMHTYEEKNNGYSIQCIEGNDTFPVSGNSISEDILSYLKLLANEKNLNSIEQLEMDVLGGPNVTYNARIIKVLEEYVHIPNKYMIEDIILEIIDKLGKEKEMMIDKYGVNYEGYSYVKRNGVLNKGEFDLLAYTIHSKDIVKIINTL